MPARWAECCHISPACARAGGHYAAGLRTIPHVRHRCRGCCLANPDREPQRHPACLLPLLESIEASVTTTFAQMIGFYLQREHATTGRPQNTAHARYTVGWLTLVFVALCFIVLMSTRVRGAADSGQHPTVSVVESDDRWSASGDTCSRKSIGEQRCDGSLLGS